MVYLGEIIAVPYNFAPKGFALCSGQLLPISQNTALFSLIGTYYGGNGTSNFALPNLNGRAALSQGQGPGLTPRVIGEEAGVENVTLLTTEMPAHTHAAKAVDALGSTNDPQGALFAQGRAGRGAAKGYAATSPAPATAQLAPTAVGIAGGSQPHNNLAPLLVMNYIIALQGLFPPRS
jgi:microcystin-dependent protein